MARLEGERSLELLFSKDGISRTELLDHRGIQAHSFLQLRRNDETLALQLCHFGFHVAFAVDGQRIGRDIAGITAQHLVDDVPEGGLAVSAVAISNNHRFRVHLADQTKPADHLHIVDQALVTAEEHLQGILPDLATFLIRHDRRHFGDQVSRISRSPAVQTFGEVVGAAGCIQQVRIAVKLFRVLQHQRLCGIEGIVQTADVAVFQYEIMIQLGKSEQTISSALFRSQAVTELLTACLRQRSRNAQLLQHTQVMPEDGEQRIRELFGDQRKYIDSDINISADQSRRLAEAIRNGAKYPEIQNNQFPHATVLAFLEKLSRIFDWDKYERKTLGKLNKQGGHARLSWYAVILCRWMEGHGLSYIMKKAVDYMRNHPDKFWLNDYTPAVFSDIPEHRNIVYADTLEVIENVILFSISNYFLRFSNMYIEINGEGSLDKNNWYEYVEYGTTNETIVFLQRNGFSRESANYIKSHPEYIIEEETGLILRRSLLNCKNTDVRAEAELIALNRPKLFEEIKS